MKNFQNIGVNILDDSDSRISEVLLLGVLFFVGYYQRYIIIHIFIHFVL